MSHNGALETSTTQPLPPFPPHQGEERRRSARLPLTEPVRIGPPQGKPAATVSAVDLSANGLFIDADRPVRVGARFSLEVPLPGGERIYIPEAEVAYNRSRPKGNGFGVRFVACPPGLLLKIAAAVESAAEVVEAPVVTRMTVPKDEPISELPTLAPVPRAAISAKPSVKPVISVKPMMLEKPIAPPITDSMKMSIRPVDLSEYPEPEIVAEELAAPTAIPKEPTIVDSIKAQENDEPITEKIFQILAGARGQLADRARELPRLWTGLCAVGGLTVALAIALTLYTGSSAEAVEPSAPVVERGVSSRTHQALMGGASMAEVGVVAQPQAADVVDLAPKKPLPPLVLVEEPQAEVEARPAPVVTVERKEATVEKKEVNAQPVAAKVVATKTLTTNKPSSGRGTLTIGIEKGARVLRTHTLKSPDRFVIDLVGQVSAPSLPGATGRIKALRAGKHPEYTRIVLDSAVPITAGTAQKDGDKLLLTLSFD